MGLFVPIIGVMAGVALILYCSRAVISVVHARWYAHIVYPLLYVAPVIGALALRYPA